MNRSKETCYKTTKSLFSIYHKLHRRPCKTAKYSAFQVSHRLKESRPYKIHVWNITHHASYNTLTYIKYEFEVLQNIRVKMICFVKINKKLNKILCPLKEKKKGGKKSITSRQMFFFTCL